MYTKSHVVYVYILLIRDQMVSDTGDSINCQAKVQWNVPDEELDIFCPCSMSVLSDISFVIWVPLCQPTL